MLPHRMRGIFAMALPLAAASAAAAAAGWTRSSTGLPDKFLDAMSIEHNAVRALARSDTTLFAGLERGGVYRSDDGGQSWIATPPLAALSSCDITQMAALAQRVFAACRYPGGMFRFDPAAPAWQQINTGLAGLAKNGQALVAVGDALYYAAAAPLGQAGPGVYVSADLGDHWTRLPTAGMEDQNVYSLASDGTFLYAGTLGDNATTSFGVAYRLALDGGTTWTRIDNGFDPNGAHYDSVFAMTAAPGLVFAGTDDKGFYRSADHGDAWQKVTGDTVGDVWGAFVAGRQVFFGTNHGGVYRSDDRGLGFVPDSEGLAWGAQTLPELSRHFLAVDSTIFVATDLGVFRQALLAPYVDDRLFFDDFEP